MPEEKFFVFEIFPDGSQNLVEGGLNAEKAVARAHASTMKPAVHLGIIQKVMITDESGSCVFLWDDGQVVHPPQSIEGHG